jgi:hypothetical protein
MMSIGAQKSSPSSVPLSRRYDGSHYDVQTPGRNVLFPPFASWTHDRTDSGYLLRGKRVWGEPFRASRNCGIEFLMYLRCVCGKQPMDRDGT